MRRVEHSHWFTSVIVPIIDEDRVAVFEGKCQPPISADIDRPMAFHAASKRVKPPAGSIHILRTGRVVQSEKLAVQLFGMLCLDARFRSSLKELLDTSVPEALYH